MSNSEGLEGEADAAAWHQEHLGAVAAIEGDVLPAAIESQVVRADGERAGDGDGATTTEGDRVFQGRRCPGRCRSGPGRSPHYNR